MSRKTIEIIPLAQKKMIRRRILAAWVEEALVSPEQVVEGYEGLQVAQKRIVSSKWKRAAFAGCVRRDLNYVHRDNNLLNLRHCSLLEGESMRIEYDPVHDLLNLEFLPDVEVEESVEIDGVILDYAKDRRIVAIEVLDASKRTAQDPLHLIDVAIVRHTAEKERT
jgi:uncharacterized protein YuzE